MSCPSCDSLKQQKKTEELLAFAVSGHEMLFAKFGYYHIPFYNVNPSIHNPTHPRFRCVMMCWGVIFSSYFEPEIHVETFRFFCFEDHFLVWIHQPSSIRNVSTICTKSLTFSSTMFRFINHRSIAQVTAVGQEVGETLWFLDGINVWV